MTLKQRLEVLEAKIETLTTQVGTLTTHFTNHLSHHNIDRVLNAVYTIGVIAMFCFLRWGGK